MPKKVTIPIDFPSPITDAECTSSYLVEYKLSSAVSYVSEIQVNPYEVVINNLLDNETYNIRITRNCCGGLVSAPTLIDVDTSTTSP